MPAGKSEGDTYVAIPWISNPTHSGINGGIIEKHLFLFKILQTLRRYI